MIAGVFLGNGIFEVKEMPKPVITEHNNVLLKNKYASICGTELKALSVPPAYHARLGNILGHEYCGQILEVGSNVKNFKVGDRVVVEVNYGCGYCHYCLHDLPQFCENMTTIGMLQDGGFAEYSAVPEKALIKMPDSVSFEKGALVEVLACVITGFKKLNFKVSQSAVVFGAGPVGCLFIQMLRKSGASKIYSIEISEYRSNFAKSIGADYIYNASKVSTDDIIVDILKKEPYGVNIAIEAGYGISFPECIRLATKGGKILLFGVNSKAIQVVKQYDITTHGLQVIGSWGYDCPNYPFHTAFKIISENLINLDKLITKRLDLRDMKQGIESLKKSKEIKVLINCDVK